MSLNSIRKSTVRSNTLLEKVQQRILDNQRRLSSGGDNEGTNHTKHLAE